MKAMLLIFFLNQGHVTIVEYDSLSACEAAKEQIADKIVEKSTVFCTIKN